MIKAVKLVTIPVRNQDKAVEFYTKKLGFQILTDQPFDGKQRWIELRIPGADTGIALYTPEGHQDRIGKFTGIAFWSEDVERCYQELSARGVEFPQPPQKAEWGTSSVFKDPDGNQFALSSR